MRADDLEREDGSQVGDEMGDWLRYLPRASWAWLERATQGAWLRLQGVLNAAWLPGDAVHSARVNALRPLVAGLSNEWARRGAGPDAARLARAGATLQRIAADHYAARRRREAEAFIRATGRVF